MSLYNKLNDETIKALQVYSREFNLTEKKFCRNFENNFEELKISDCNKLIKDEITEDDIINHIKRCIELDANSYYHGTCEIIKRNNIKLSDNAIKRIAEILTNEIEDFVMLLKDVYHYSDDLIYKLVYRNKSVLRFRGKIGEYRQKLMSELYEHLTVSSLRLLNCIITAIEFNDTDILYANYMSSSDFSEIVDYMIELGKEKENGKEIILQYLKNNICSLADEFNYEDILEVMDSLNIDYNELLNVDNIMIGNTIFIDIGSALNDMKKLVFIKKYIDNVCIKNNKFYVIRISSHTPLECKFTDTLKEVTELVETIINKKYSSCVEIRGMTNLQFTTKVKRFFKNNYDASYMLRLLKKESSMIFEINRPRFFGKLWKNDEHEEKTDVDKELNDSIYNRHYQKYYINLIDNGYFESDEFKKLDTNNIVRIIENANNPKDSYTSYNYDNKIISILNNIENTEVYDEIVLNTNCRSFLKNAAFILNLQRSENLERFVKKYLAKTKNARKSINQSIFRNLAKYDIELMNAIPEAKKHEMFDYGFLDITPYIKELTEAEQLSIVMSNDEDLIKLLWNTKYDSVNNLMKMRK